MQIGKERTNMWCAQLNSFGLSDVENFEMKKKNFKDKVLVQKIQFLYCHRF